MFLYVSTLSLMRARNDVESYQGSNIPNNSPNVSGQIPTRLSVYIP